MEVEPESGVKPLSCCLPRSRSIAELLGLGRDSWHPDSNREPAAYKTAALPIGAMPASKMERTTRLELANLLPGKQPLCQLSYVRMKWSGWWASIPRPPDPQSGALPGCATAG